MIIDFHHHFTPRELFKEDLGDRLILTYDETGAPSYTSHALLYDLDRHIRMMDEAGIDAAFLTSAAGMSADLDRSRFINDKVKEAERNYPGRFIGCAHANPLGGPEALKELRRCAEELGFPGVVITSEAQGLFLDAADYEPFWTEASRLGMFVFVHPALKLNFPQSYSTDDTARSIGREISLVLATIKLINSGVFDRHPSLTVQMSHLGGGVSGIIERVRAYQDKVFWGTAGNPRHGRTPQQDFDYYLTNHLVFDTGGFSGVIGAVKCALLELPNARIVFGTDYPQEIRTYEVVRNFITDIRALGSASESIVSGNESVLLKNLSKPISA